MAKEQVRNEEAAGENTIVPAPGIAVQLTKREYLAAVALQGILASSHDEGRYSENDMAIMAVKQADALMALLQRTAGDQNPYASEFFDYGSARKEMD